MQLSGAKQPDDSRLAMVATIILLSLTSFTLLYGDYGYANFFSGGRQLGSSGEEEEGHPYYAIIFPCIAILAGIIVHYILSHYLHHILPYTAVMFGFGTIMGMVLHLLPENQFKMSFEWWSFINGHLLLMTFLPGLLFKDAYSLDIHLFRKAFGQCSIMAFPEVLIFTVVTGWFVSFVIYNVGADTWGADTTVGERLISGMVLGSILAATDPVAVSALLNEVGAPPRLKTHVAGESLLNDGAAVVFFNIFYNMDLYIFTEGELGKTFNLGSGIVYFLKLSLGSTALGIAFGLVLILFLWALNNRYNYEENVVQVMATIGFAYFSFYVAEGMLHLSGIMCVVFCAITAKYFAGSMINDQVSMGKFWDLFEHILNTILFTLGGLVWGTVITNQRGMIKYGAEYALIGGRQWGILFAIYFFCLVLRACLVFGFYPLVSRIGLKSSIKEAVFMTWGGLRGAVGIALGIVIENAWNDIDVEKTELTEERIFLAQAAANEFFFYAGGMAFLTLFINGSTAGPLIKKLGLAAASTFREKLINRYRRSMSLEALEHMFQLLGDSLFSGSDFAVVRTYVPVMKDITDEDIRLALKRNKTKQPYCEPNLTSLESYFSPEQFREFEELARASESTTIGNCSSYEKVEEVADDEDSKEEAIEMRKVFINLLRVAYEKQVEKGFINSRAGGFLVFKLTSSLELAADNVAEGGSIRDWEICAGFNNVVDKIAAGNRRASIVVNRKGSVLNKDELKEYKKSTVVIQRAISCISAHKLAQESFKEKHCNYCDDTMTAVEQIILAESNKQIELAETTIASNSSSCSIISHLLAGIILNQMIHTANGYVDNGLLLRPEGEKIVHSLEHQLHALDQNDGVLSDSNDTGEGADGEKLQSEGEDAL
mmetsp:Transcript_22808/g.33682  ORF Transcript_22808/g.33682 Transcript_22808/m.33682 type:complete len:885 (-) Transcript_22808:166-2820(-)|eukprot:CAMPEP_0194211838 /NCGR_PEP_ID=MMETSP0156-20130528/11263_1 /TAXON_ID=33649 /ORGANISM="Thalassionema nitzschioides, Strain L26-B" /LENGTH=884 /DNA_ID=CAMNT_0038939519 /DNA_START=161 /DNA_END=2815 /DNA_ORIENTATION=-